MEIDMKLKIELTNPFWWFWAVTLVFITAALSGWTAGYYIVMLISAIQVGVFIIRERSLLAFPTQIRIVYFVWTAIGFWIAGRFPFYVLLLIGTIMVVFFNRCSISLLLKHMPWNHNKVPRLV
jgi:hypothetical protein